MESDLVGSMYMAMKYMKYLSKNNKYKVCGYIREMEQQLNLPSIPLLIVYKCLLFAIEQDYFDNTHSSFEYSNTDKTITNIAGCHSWNNSHHVKGNLFFDVKSNTIAEWRIKINKCKKFGAGIMIGLMNETDSVYRLHNSGNFYYPSLTSLTYEKEFSFAKMFGEGDIITLIFDMKNQEIKCKINNETEIELTTIAKHDYTTKLRFCANIFYKNDSISITDFYVHL
eukprot:407180_1